MSTFQIERHENGKVLFHGRPNFKFFLNNVAKGHRFFVQKTGKCFVWGRNQTNQAGVKEPVNFPEPSPIFQNFFGKIKKISCGVTSTHVLTKSGLAYSCGYCGFGSLGIGKGIKSCENPTAIPSFSGNIVENIFSGSNHSIFVVSGSIFSSGNNKNGQLGIGILGKYSLSFIPLKMKFLQTQKILKIKKIIAGQYYTVILCASGTVYKVGSIYKEKNKNSHATPMKKNSTNFSDVKDVFGGVYHIFLLCASGEVYGMGDNFRNQVFNFKKSSTRKMNVTDITHLPVLTQFNQKFHTKIIDIQSGYAHTCVLLNNSTCLAYGDLDCVGCQNIRGDENGIVEIKMKNVCRVFCGRYDTWFVDYNGVWWCGGDNVGDKLGLGGEVKPRDGYSCVFENKKVFDVEIIDEFGYGIERMYKIKLFQKLNLQIYTNVVIITKN